LGECIISTKIKLVLAGLCVVFIVTTAGSIVYYNSVISDKDNRISALNAQVASLNTKVNQLNVTVNELNAEIGPKNAQINNLNSQINNLNAQIAGLNSQIANLTSQEANKPNVVVQSLTVQDDRSSVPYSLHVSATITNTGGSTAYEAYLHVVAINAEGTAIDSMYSFTGITPHVNLGLDFRLNYTGSPIQSWSVTPVWNGGTGITTTSNSTFT
jgi:cell division protein FtsL